MARTSESGSEHEMPIVPAPAQDRTAQLPVSQAIIDESVPSGVPTKRSNLKQILSIIALFATLFITALNATIVATALPTIVRDLNSASGYGWIGAAYLLGNAASGPIWAKLSDIWGRKPILLTAVACYFFSSIVCALAKDMSMLIAGRALQGVAGGGLSQLIHIVISDLFSMRHRGLYMGLCEIIWCIASGVGPVLGGALAQQASWRWIFWISLPICFVAFTLLLFALSVHNPRTPLKTGLKAIDWAGSVLILALLIMFLLGLNFGGVDYPWDSPTVICLLVLGAGMSVFFVLAEKKIAKYPLMPMGLFKSRSNVAALIVGLSQDYALITAEFYLPLFFQSAFAQDPVRSGVLVLPMTVSGSLTGLVAGVIMHRTGRYVELIYLGMFFSTLGFGLLIYWTATTALGIIIGFQLIVALGVGLLFSPPLIAIQARVPQQDTATATSTYCLAKNIATVLAVVIGQTIFQNGMDNRTGDLVAAGLTVEEAAMFGGSSAAANIEEIAGIRDAAVQVGVRNVFASSIRSIWILSTAICAFGLLASAFITKTHLSEEHVETRTGLEKQDADAERR